MRKIFTFLCAALMSVGMFATTVTWNNNDITSSSGYGTSFTKDGVTITAGIIDFNDKNFMDGGTFTTTLGNFTKIEVTAMSLSMLSGEGWSGNTQKKTWTGNASSVSFSGDIMGMGMGNTQFVFTIEEPTVAVTGVTLNQSEAQMTVGGETLTLTATVNPNNATDQSVSWSTSDGDVATVDNGVVTAVAAGNATITVTTTDGSFTATCAITVTAPEPAKYYIVGSMNSWGVDENYEMNPSLDAETEEYFYTLDLTTTSEFKVVKVQNGQQSWIPEGMGNNYGQNGEITEDGEYTVYFRPNYDGGEDWFYSCIYAEKTGEFVPETPTYYLVGSMTEWDVNENYELNPNIDSDIEEYFYVLDLTTSSQFKVVKVQNGQQTWYPSGMGNNYGENGEITEDGEYTVYFRPNYNGGEDWFYNCIYVSKNEPQVERELTKLGFNFPSENIPADNDIEMAGTFEEGTMWMEKIIATGWFVSYDFVNAAEDETFKLRSKSNNDLVLCQFIPANNGEGGKWVQAIFTFGNYWSDDTWKGTPCKLIEEDLSDAAQYAWMEGMPEPEPEPEPEPATTVVTITDSDFPASEKSFTKDGVTVSAYAIDGMQGNISGPGSFSTTLGNFTKIEVSAASISVSGEGWSGDFEHKTWTGNASSVSFTGSINGYEEGLTLKFTIESQGEPTGVENVQTNHVQATKFFRDGMLLIVRDGKTYNVQGVEVK